MENTLEIITTILISWLITGTMALAFSIGFI